MGAYSSKNFLKCVSTGIKYLNGKYFLYFFV